jgi:hypothetical protein
MPRSSESFTENAISGLEKYSEGLKPVSAKDDDVEVNAKLATWFPIWLEQYHDFLLFMASEKNHPLNVTTEDLNRLIATVLDSRVKWVRRKPGRVLHYNDRITVPTLMHVSFSAFGIAKDESRGITFVPTYTPQVDLMTREECEAVSRRLNPLRHLGVNFASGFSREHNGSLHLMSMRFLRNHLDGRSGVFSVNEQAKAYAICAFVLELEELQHLLGEERMIYGDESTLSSRIFEIIELERKAA